MLARIQLDTDRKRLSKNSSSPRVADPMGSPSFKDLKAFLQSQGPL